MAVLVVVWLACALFGCAIGSNKGRGGTGFVLGLLLGVIGVIVIAVMRPAPEAHARRNQPVTVAARNLDSQPWLRPCPWCAEKIQPTAKTCRHCGRELEPITMVLPPRPTYTSEAWLSDPSGRHPDRWWDGSTWTQLVRDRAGGESSDDPPVH
jgi:hypothetical protein